MKFLRLFHLYTGLILSLALFLIAVSGGLLLYKHEYWQLQMTELRSPDVVPPFDEQAQAIGKAYSLFGEQLISIKMPEPDVPAYHLYLDRGEVLMSVSDHRIIDQWELRQRLMGFLFDLHAHLLAGHTGELIAGVIGLAGGVMAITGLILWWPIRRAVSLRHLWIRDSSRKALLAWHREAGLLMSPLLLLLIFSGSAMVFYTQVQTVMNAAFGDEVPRVNLPPRPPTTAGTLPDAAMLEQVSQHFSETKLLYYFFDANTTGFHRFRLRRSCELHPNGLSFVYTDAETGKLVGSVDACNMPPGERLTNMIYPLHAGKIGSETYRILSLLTAFVLAGLSLSGVITYFQRLKRLRGKYV